MRATTRSSWSSAKEGTVISDHWNTGGNCLVHPVDVHLGGWMGYTLTRGALAMASQREEDLQPIDPIGGKEMNIRLPASLVFTKVWRFLTHRQIHVHIQNLCSCNASHPFQMTADFMQDSDWFVLEYCIKASLLQWLRPVGKSEIFTIPVSANAELETNRLIHFIWGFP